MWTAAILCGGQAMRFGGRDKSALVVNGQTILDRQLAMLALVPRREETLLVGGRSTHPAARQVHDIAPGSGPLAGIHTALTEARTNAVFVLACDMPYVSAGFASYLIGLAAEADLVIPRIDNRYHPLCAVYTRACLAPIVRRLAEGRLKVVDLVDDVRTRLVTVPDLDRFGDPHRLLQNVNTPIEYAALQAARQHQP